jgi:hypothetical protein
VRRLVVLGLAALAAAALTAGIAHAALWLNFSTFFQRDPSHPFRVKRVRAAG